MSGILRILLVILAVGSTIWILHKIKKSKVKMEDSIFWIIFSFLLIVLAVFPQLTYKLSNLLGIISPVNFIFLMIIFLLIEKIFTLSIITSQLEEKVSLLAAELALRSQAQEKEIEKIEHEVSDEK